MEKVSSRDGTRIAYYRRGVGPPLVLVHGSGATNPVDGWTAVMPTLVQQFTVYALDRRGYGESGDNPNYALAREIEDLTAVLEAIGQPVYLLGHSYGALVALETALVTSQVRKLILYEPGMTLADAPLYAEGVVERLQALGEAGDREEILRTIYCDVAMMPIVLFEELKTSPAWATRLARAHNVPREARVEQDYRFEASRFHSVHTPTLLLLGGNSPQTFKKMTGTLVAAMPNGRIAVLAGQEHIAMYTAPDLFLDEILIFLNEPAQTAG